MGRLRRRSGTEPVLIKLFMVFDVEAFDKVFDISNVVPVDERVNK